MNLIFEDRWLLAEKDPALATRNQFRWRMKIDIRDPDPDMANFPNGAYTVPKGRMMIENSPVGLYGPNTITPPVYNWEFLVRYGRPTTWNCGSFERADGDQRQRGDDRILTLGVRFQDELLGREHQILDPRHGRGILTSRPTSVPPRSTAVLSLPPACSSITRCRGGSVTSTTSASRGTEGPFRLNVYEFSYQWSLEHQVVKDFNVFWQGFYNALALPRLPLLRPPAS